MYYRKFIKGFSSIAKLLYVLTENQSKYLWEEKCQIAFDNLKSTYIVLHRAFFFKGEREVYFRTLQISILALSYYKYKERRKESLHILAEC